MRNHFDRIVTGALALVTSALAVPATAAVVSVADEASGWVLRVDGQPFFVRGISYTPEKVGEDPNAATLRNWMSVDDNRNGFVDTAYESFVDANRNNLKDAGEPSVGDWSLLREMGVNTIRIYHHASNDPSVTPGYVGASSQLQYNQAPNKAVLRDLFASHGIRVAMGDFLGAYTIGSGTNTTTDYTNSAQRARMLASVRQMVVDFKDEPWLLVYVLGNENNYDSITFGNANAQAAAFASLVGEAVDLIKSLDTNHPVVICLGDDGDNLTAALAALPSGSQPDIIGTNVYRYPAFEGIFPIYAGAWDKPVLFTEFGDPATQFTASDINETRQADVYDEGFDDIEANAAGGAGADNAIGGIAFAWLDSWWQSGTAREHNIVGSGGFENEWHGVAAQGNGARSLFLRQLRQAYFTLQNRFLGLGRTVPAAGGTLVFNPAAGITLLQFPAGAFANPASVTFNTPGSFPAGASVTHDMVPTGAGFEITEASGQQPHGPVKIFYPYPHGNGGYILARFDAARNAWIALPTRRDSAGVLSAETTHFTLFQVMQVSPSVSVDRGLAFPNPARPAQGHTGMTFSQLPPGAAVKLFTASGELVRELNADAAGTALWDLRNRDGREAASGVYFALLDGAGGTRTIKVAVQR